MDITCRHAECNETFPTYEERTDHEISEHYNDDVSSFFILIFSYIGVLWIYTFIVDWYGFITIVINL